MELSAQNIMKLADRGVATEIDNFRDFTTEKVTHWNITFKCSDRQTTMKHHGRNLEKVWADAIEGLRLIAPTVLMD